MAAFKSSTSAYLEEIGRIPLLTPAEEIHLGTAVREWLDAGDQATARQKRIGKRAMDRMVSANLRLVVVVAKRFAANRKIQSELLDLIQHGSIGLIRAVEKFEPQRGYKFSTYAYWWIRQAISRGIATDERTIRIPVHGTTGLAKLSKYKVLFQQAHGRKPSLKECAEHLGCNEDTLRLWLGMANDAGSLDQRCGDSDSSELKDLVACNRPSPEDEVERRYETEQMQEALSFLSEREQVVITMRHGLTDGQQSTYGEIGNRLGISREAARNAENAALLQLRKRLTRSVA